MLVVAGCSSDSDSKGEADASSTGPSSKASPTVPPAKYSELPKACETIGGKTIESLVPKAKTKGGTEGKSSDLASRSSCSWNGLDDNGVKGSQYRWLDVSMRRYDSDVARGSGAQLAGKYFTTEVSDAQGTEGAKDVKTAPASGIGDQATTVTYSLKKTGEEFAYAMVVARTENVTITLTYNGTGYAGAKSPSSADLAKDAVKAAKEAVAGITEGSAQSSGSSGSDESSKATDKATEKTSDKETSKDS